ncbi:NADPH-dependent oxidoreductase [Peptoniphilaceae bacterium SGI.131]
MNETIKTLLNHRSIRKWKDDPISEDKVNLLFEVANRTSTSTGMQNASIIRVKDQAKREAMAKIGKQPYLATAPELLVFIVDNYRNVKIMEEKEAGPIFANDTDRFFQGWTDASLMAQSVAVAAESMGLGIVYFGCILNDQEELIRLLDLPENTYPVVGMGIGYADQAPELKPRMEIEHRVFVDTYKKFDSYLKEFEEYDQVMQTYYDLRNANQRVDSFTKQVVDKNMSEVEKKSETFDLIKKQGFKVSY